MIIRESSPIATKAPAVPQVDPTGRLGDIEKAFGVSTGTGQGRSKAIRETLRKITPEDCVGLFRHCGYPLQTT